jgi:hypothetical protein
MLNRLTPIFLSVAAVPIFPFFAYAESADAEARINQLQMQELSQELQTVQQQFAQN